MRKSPLPHGWTKAALEDVAEVQTGIAKGKLVSGQSVSVPYLRVANVQDGYVDLSIIKEIVVKLAEVERYRLRKGDVLFTEGGDFDKLGRGTVWQGEIDPCLHQNHVFAVRPSSARLLPAILALQAASDYGRRYFQLSSKQSTNLASINSTQLKQFPVIVPPLPDQRKIAAILRTWDLGLEKLSALRKAKEARLDALRASLLFGTVRMGATRLNWPMRRLGEVTRELTQRNTKLALDRAAVMGVSNARGIVPMREQTVAGDISRYLLLPPLGFAYNPMRINVGSIAMNKAEETFLVSPDYVVFACRPDGMEPDYLDHLRQTRWWLHHINAGGSGSVRQRTYYDDLAALQLRLPGIEEQHSIVAVLNAAKTDVELTEREIAALTRQKRGLMQKLLTGEWPVQPDMETAHG